MINNQKINPPSRILIAIQASRLVHLPAPACTSGSPSPPPTFMSHPPGMSADKVSDLKFMGAGSSLRGSFWRSSDKIHRWQKVAKVPDLSQRTNERISTLYASRDKKRGMVQLCLDGFVFINLVHLVSVARYLRLRRRRRRRCKERRAGSAR